MTNPIRLTILTTFMALLVLPISAQIPSGYVQTTATVPALAGGTFGAAWTNLSSSPQLGLLGCVSTFQNTVNGSIDSYGHFSTLLADTAQICPTPSTWTFTLSCPAASPGAFQIQVAITGGGGTEDISSQITAALPAGICSGGGGGTVAIATNIAGGTGYEILVQTGANTTGFVTGGTGLLYQSSAVSMPIITSSPYVTANANPYDASSQAANDLYVQNAVNLTMATSPFTITGGTISFNSLGSGSTLNYSVTSGAITTINSWMATGANYLVGDVITPQAGNYDAMIRITAVNGSNQPTAGTILYGGTGYSAGTAVAGTAANTIEFTFLLSGTLTSNATLIMAHGTYRTQSNQWIFANNTTGAYTVTVCVGGATDACAAGGRTVVVPQGTNNSASELLQTDGELNVDQAIGYLPGYAPLSGATFTGAVSGQITPTYPTGTNYSSYNAWVDNSISLIAEHQYGQGLSSAMDLFAIGLAVPPTSTAYQADALAVYMNSASTTTNAVSAYFSARAVANGVHAWAINPIFMDGGFSGVTGTAAEFDCNVYNTGTNGSCIQIDGAFAGTLSSFPAVHIGTHGGGKWSVGIALDDGESQTGIVIGAQNAGPSNYSQTIGLSGKNASGVNEQAYLQADPNGNLLLEGNDVLAGTTTDCGQKLCTGTLGLSGAIYQQTQAPGLNIYAPYFNSYGANTNWPFTMGTIYDAGNVDQLIGLNVGTIGGTRAATTFTGSGDGGTVLRMLNNQAVLCWVPIGAGQSCSNVMTWNASGPVFPLGLSNSNGTLLPSTALGYKSANSTGAAYVELVLTGTTGTITGTALTTTCDSGTATVTGAVVGHPVAVSSTTGADVGGAFNLRASVTATGVVTVYVCGTGTPASLAYNVTVF